MSRQRPNTVSPPPGGVYRLARGPAEPFDPPDWARALDDGTFGNRFDDPSAKDGFPLEKRFRTIYCATQRAATFGETLARFRLDLKLVAELEEIEDEDTVAESLAGSVDPLDQEYPRHGLIPADWRLKRRLGHTMLDPSLKFVDIVGPETLQYLRHPMARIAYEHGFPDVDVSTVTASDRGFTQVCARHFHEQVDETGQPRYAGIRYPSRLNSGKWECWAVFGDRIRHEPGYPGYPANFHADDSDLKATASLFSLTIEMFSGQDHYIRPWDNTS